MAETRIGPFFMVLSTGGVIITDSYFMNVDYHDAILKGLGMEILWLHSGQGANLKQ
jgi:hypothetical protein